MPVRPVDVGMSGRAPRDAGVAVSLRNVRRTYDVGGTVEALAGISLTLARGSS